jgi:predicted  nucleic acid-binding Zn-ribbon protein
MTQKKNPAPKVGLTQKQANSGTSPIQQAAEKEKLEKGSKSEETPLESEASSLESEETPLESEASSLESEVTPVDKATYDRYTALKFLELSGTKLKEDHVKELVDLEKTLKACSGVIPIRTVTAAISNEKVRLVEGVPIPEAYAKIIASCKNPAYYIG